MYYSAGNYEPLPPPKARQCGRQICLHRRLRLAALSAACYLVRDAQMKGEHVHILEKDPIPGGACDGYHYENLATSCAAGARWTTT